MALFVAAPGGVPNGAACTTSSQCTSGVCDPADNLCGYATGDGPCTAANAALCRSGVCLGTLVCGCVQDTDCPAGSFCGGQDAGCFTRITNGFPCSRATECVSGFCADGACCSTACNGTCDSCVSGAAGTCSTLFNLSNPTHPCPSGNVCNGSGPTAAACSTAGLANPCTMDIQCQFDWCNVSTALCEALVADGSAMPNVPGDAMLTGTCTTAAATRVCYAKACDTDNKCGLADGSACTNASQCRSGACGASGTCTPLFGCNADADCAAIHPWCNVSHHSCAKLESNGAPIPDDPLHTNPALSGACTPQAAMKVCASGACSMLANVCIPAAAGSCALDAECAAGQWCDEQAFTCTPRLANGTLLPKDPPHANPTLDGTCTPAAAVLVCQSGVCDPASNRCGLATGTGCVPGDCKSGFCASGVCCDTACTGTCMACNVVGSVGTCTFVPMGGTDESHQPPCYAPSACNGAGACVSQSTSACMTSADCPAGTFCAGGVCVGNPGQGSQCKADADCATVSGGQHCSREGVCCDRACTGKCEQCLYPSVGTCSVQPGIDLHTECLAAGMNPCGNETCEPANGGGVCLPATTATPCALGTCSEDGLHGTGPVFCTASDGGGLACPKYGAMPFDCTTDYRCEPGLGRCKDGCSTVNDCVPGYVCNLSGRCEPQSVAFTAAPSGCSLSARSDGDGAPGGRVAMLLMCALAATVRRRAQSKGPRRFPKVIERVG